MAGDPAFELTADDFTNFQVQRRRVQDTYNLGVGQNAYQQEVLARGRDRSLSDLKHQYAQTSRKIPGRFARGGTLNSGIFGRAKYDFNNEYNRAVNNVFSQWGDQQQGLDYAKFGLGVTSFGAQNDLNEQEQARRATAMALRAGVG